MAEREEERKGMGEESVRGGGECSFGGGVIARKWWCGEEFEADQDQDWAYPPPPFAFPPFPAPELEDIAP